MVTHMEPPSIPRPGDGMVTSLLSLPAELVVSIYCFQASFPDVFALSLTCHKFQYIWLRNVPTISDHLVSMTIPCARHARVFLADQGGPSPESSLTSAADVVRMVRNARIVDEAILQFDTQVVPGARSPLLPRRFRVPADPAYDTDQHPPHLTRTERRRFTRSYYELWGLMKVNELAVRQSRLGSMTLKQLFHLHEMACLPDSIGRGEEAISASQFSCTDPDSYFKNRQGRSPERIKLDTLIVEHLERIIFLLHGEQGGRDIDGTPWLWAVHAPDEAYMDFLFIWDSWQEHLKQIVFDPIGWSYRGPRNPEIWDDSSDNEV